jgi:hypothetical protein
MTVLASVPFGVPGGRIVTINVPLATRWPQADMLPFRPDHMVK